MEARESVWLMQLPTTPDPTDKTTPLTQIQRVIAEPDFAGAPQPIDDFAGRADFPQCVLGAYIDIQGFAGVVVEIVKDSIRVRPPQGMTQRFNANRLKTLYAPSARPETVATTPGLDRSQADGAPEPSRAKPSALPRDYIADPDFTAPVRPIRFYAGQPDFPKCAYGKHVDIRGYTGVVVEFVKGSLKIQSVDGITRSYNTEVLSKIYGKA